MQEQPRDLPRTQPSGEPPFPLDEVLLRRRATPHFDKDGKISREHLDAILELTAQAPSGYNFQPWRFILVQGETNRDKLMRAAFNQDKITEAPLVVIALGMKESWKTTAGEILDDGAARGIGNPEKVGKVRQGALDFLSKMPMPVWVNRHVMIAVTTMMLAAESYGFDTAPMEGFDAEAVKREFAVPDEAEVVCLLAIGRAKGPPRPYPGRLPIDRIFYQEKFGQPYVSA